MAKRVLVIGDSMSLAHATRAMLIAHRLKNEGAEVVFATGAAHQKLAIQEGFDPREVYCVSPERAHAAIRRGSHIFDRQMLERYVQSDLSLFESVQPDLVIGDMRLSLNISAEVARIEYWSVLNGYLTKYYAAWRRPPKTLPGMRYLGQRLGTTVLPAIEAFMIRYYAMHFRRYRKALGLSPIDDIYDVIASPHRNLIADLPDLIPCANLPSHFEYIGPLVWEPNVAEPEWMNELRDDVPTAYVSMGSTGDVRDLRRVLTAMRDAGFQVLATMGPHGKAPSGVFSTAFARGSSLLRKSQVLVCHGGSGTIYQSITEGVPIIGIATFHDQELNLERAEALRWGIVLDPLAWREQDLLAAISRVQTNTYQNAIACGQELVKASIEASKRKSLLAADRRSNVPDVLGGNAEPFTADVSRPAARGDAPRSAEIRVAAG
jgi:UDP:flavonoid glycosyltransferase YjiC (YdhE family)